MSTTSNTQKPSSGHGQIFAFTGVSGSGKSTLCKKLHEQNAGVFSISFTTRAQSKSEVEAKDYFFISKEEFQQKIDQGEMLEYATVHDNLYGTCKSWLEKTQAIGKNILLEIDVQGAKQIREKIDSVHTVFILPPSFEVLEKRLYSRKREGEDLIKKRLEHGLLELQRIKEFSYLLVNDDFDNLCKNALAIIDVCSNHPKDASMISHLLVTSQQEIVESWQQFIKSKIK